jgi:hypothetical protein
MGYRDRNTLNDGTSYGQNGSNTGVTGHSFWGDQYSFGVGGWNYNDFTRCGGTFGGEIYGSYWGSLGYKSSGTAFFGVYGSSAYSSGSGFLANTEKQGIGGGFYGDLIGSWSHGEVMGQVNSGELFASYNVGNEYTSGYSADIVSTGTGRTAVYAVTSPELKVYDNGSAHLKGSAVFVPFPKSFASMLGAVPNVTVSAVGSPAQLYIKSIEKNGFTVAVADGSANVDFNWIAVGTRLDANKVVALPEEILSNDFDSNINGAMFNDGNNEQSAKPLWWDGSKIRFDKAPEKRRPTNTGIEPANH